MKNGTFNCVICFSPREMLVSELQFDVKHPATGLEHNPHQFWHINLI